MPAARDMTKKREWAAKNRESARASSRRWRRANPERARRPSNPTYRREWYEANAEQERARERERHAKNRDELNAQRAERARLQRERDPGGMAAVRRQATARRRARVKAATVGDRASYAEYDAILRRDPCSYCGGEVQHADHIVPLDDGGEHDWENLTGACGSCNSRKSTKSLLVFMLEAA